MIPATNEERQKNLESLGFVVTKHAQARARSRFYEIFCPRCARAMQVFGTYGERGFMDRGGHPAMLPDPKADLHNLENDAVYMDCRFHALLCGAIKTGGERDAISHGVSSIHDLYKNMKPLSSSHRLLLARELAFYLRGLGFNEAADALDSPAWK